VARPVAGPSLWELPVRCERSWFVQKPRVSPDQPFAVFSEPMSTKVNNTIVFNDL